MINSPTPRRPRAVTITLWGVFLLGGWNTGRAIAIAQQMSMLLALEIIPDPRIRLIIALVWALIFFGLTIALRRGRPRTRQTIPISLLLYGLIELGLLLIFVQAPGARRSWMLNSITYGGMTAFAYWALNRLAATSYFKERTLGAQLTPNRL